MGPMEMRPRSLRHPTRPRCPPHPHQHTAFPFLVPHTRSPADTSKYLYDDSAEGNIPGVIVPLDERVKKRVVYDERAYYNNLEGAPKAAGRPMGPKLIKPVSAPDGGHCVDHFVAAVSASWQG